MIDGILLVDKPRDISSARAVAKLKKKYAANKAGHGGALDPLADGLLVVLFGVATGFARFCLGADKTYLAKVRFGAQTETDDSEGAIMFSSSPPPDLARHVRALLPQFIGEIKQTAPQYSALKDKGEALYKKARRGESTITKTRTLQVADIKITESDNADNTDNADNAECVLSFHIRAQSGFYVRAFARDIGLMIGCGAHLASLTRTASGVFSLSDAAPLQTILDDVQLQRLLPVEDALTSLPMQTLPLETIAKMAHGQIPVKGEEKDKSKNNKSEDAKSKSERNESEEAKSESKSKESENNEGKSESNESKNNEGESENNESEKPIRIYSPCGKFAGIASGTPQKPIRFLQWTRTEIPLTK